MKTLLVIDDNEKIRQILREYLQESGYNILIAENGKDGIENLKGNIGKVNLIIVDCNMPELDGLQFCRFVRNELSLTGLPIIMITARGDINNKINGYEAGADDFLVKPFELVELVLRIESLLKGRKNTNNEQQFQAGNEPIIIVEKNSFSVKVKGQKIKLSPTEFDLFYLLYENANRFVTHDLILQKVFGFHPGTGVPETVRTHIRNLRRKIEDEPGNPKIITSLIKRGYMLNV